MSTVIIKSPKPVFVFTKSAFCDTLSKNRPMGSDSKGAKIYGTHEIWMGQAADLHQ